MILRYVISGMLAIAVFLSAEPDGTCGSPYSANGIGTVIPDNVGGAMSMGGAGIANGDGSNLLRDNPKLFRDFFRNKRRVEKHVTLNIHALFNILRWNCDYKRGEIITSISVIISAD